MVVSESSINNIMGGLESTGGVTLHNHRRKLKQRFETIAKLGQGTYGKVQLGINKETGQEVAIKTIKKCKIETEADLIRIRREIQIMSSLRHPYIIHIYEVFENRDKMVLVMEYAAGGELYDYLSKKKVLDEQEARRIFRQIAMAVYYCHKHQICHRDLKLENILLDEQGNAKIADFGLSNVFDKSRLLSTFCGSPLYASPEIVKGIPYNGPEVDCWSMGVLLYTLVYGAMPFDGSNFKRLVRQISAGEYFEPKVPSSASELIAGLLTVKGTERLDITGVCQHAWMSEEGKVSCYRLAVELAEQEPNRLDLLLALAPQENQIPSVPEEVAAPQSTPERPSRSLSLSSLPTVQPSFTAPIPSPSKEKEESEKPPDKEKKRERSSSRTRKKETDEEKPKKKSVKTKKKSDPDLSKEEMEKVLEEAKKLSEIIAKAPVVEAGKVDETSLPEVKQSASAKTEESSSSAQPKLLDSKEELKEKPKEIKKVKKVKQEKKDEEKKDQPTPARPSLRKEKEIDLPDKEVDSTKAGLEEDQAKPGTVPREAAHVQKEPEPGRVSDPKEAPPEPPSPFRRDSVRRKSKVFETAEMFSKSPTQEKVPQKKVFLPGVKVSDAKAAFERRSSVSQETKPDVSLASTINVNKLVQSELNLDKDNKEEEKMKKEKAVKVITHAISESGMNKASTLPRRKLSKPSLTPRVEAEPLVARPGAPQGPCPAPVPPPRPSLSTQESGPKEYIIPIQIEKREDKPPPVSKQASLSSRTSSISSIGRQDSDSSTATVGTPTLSASSEPIRKSPREVIIPIAVEGGGFVTPSASTLSKMGSMSEGEDEERPSTGPLRGFGLHSTRRRVEATDSLSSDEEDDNFEMLTAENLFSSLLSRVRNLTYRLNENEGRPTFPRLFNHSLFDSPTSRRRLTETKSFTEQDPAPWRRKRETTPSSTLPRGFTTRSFRRTLTGGDENRREGRPPVGGSSSASLRNRMRSEEEIVEDFLATGKLSSLDRVRSYLEGLRRTNLESTSAPPLRRYLSESPRTDYPPIPRHRLSSLDGSGRNDHYSYLNEERNLSNGQKKTSRTQSDAWTQNGENGLISPSKDCNGFFESRYSSPRRDIESCAVGGGPNTLAATERRLPRAQEDSNNAFKPSDKIPTIKDKLIDVSSNQKVRLEKNSVPECLLNNHSLANPESSEKSLQNSDEMKTIDNINNKSKISDLNGKASKLQKASEITKVRKNSEVGNKVSKSNNKQDITVAGSSEQVKKESSKRKSLISEGNEGSKESARVAVQTKTEDNQSQNLEKSDVSEKSLSKSDLKKVEKSAKKESKKDRNGSRVSKAINSLRKKSETYENQFTESKLLKRAVSLEDLRTDEVARSKRASSLKPEGTFEKKESPKAKKGGVFDSLSKGKEEREARLANLKRLELVKGGGEASAESTPTGDQDEEGSMISVTDNSDTWSSCDLGERLLDPSTEECVLERIRRKSFYHRFNLPKRQAYNRSLSNMERKRTPEEGRSVGLWEEERVTLDSPLSRLQPCST